MTSPILITACAIAPVALVARRLIMAVHDFPHAPRLIDREPQRSLGEGGEGEFRTIHNEGISRG